MRECRRNSRKTTWFPPLGKMRPLARDGVSREVPCSALKGETVPDSLPATPKSQDSIQQITGHSKFDTEKQNIELMF